MLLRRLPLSQPPVRQWRRHYRRRCPSLRAAAGFSTARSNDLVDQPEDASSSSMAPSPPSTLYEQLFSKKSTRRSSSHSARSRRPSLKKDGAKDVSPAPDGDLMAWLKANASTKPSSEQKTSQDQQSSETVLVMKNMPRTLLESDFYRIAAGGRHVVGWARGLVKVVQSISTMTREPRGQYYVFFDSIASANSYLSKLTYLATAAKAKAGSGLSSSTASGPAPTISDGEAPIADATPNELTTDATFLPPDIPPNTTMLGTKQLGYLVYTLASAEKTSEGSPGRPLKSSTAAPYLLGPELSGSTAGPSRNSLVTVRLVGSKITADAMSKAIAADGAARNLPWRLAEERPDDPRWPRPVQTLRAGSGKIENADATRFAYGYTRFVLAFADAAEARRFARAWHKREMYDERADRTMVVNAHALW